MIPILTGRASLLVRKTNIGLFFLHRTHTRSEILHPESFYPNIDSGGLKAVGLWELSGRSLGGVCGYVWYLRRGCSSH